MKTFHPAVAAIALSLLFAAPAHAASGSFSGASGHKTSGGVSVSQSGGKLIIKLASSFRLDGAPDPWVAVGNKSIPVKGGMAGVLRSNSGAQSYSLKLTPRVKNARQVIIWCKKFAVPIGVARLR